MDVVRCGRGRARVVSVRRVVVAMVDVFWSIGRRRAPSSINVRTKDACAPANGLSGKTGCFVSPGVEVVEGRVTNLETRLTDSRSC